MSPNPCPSSSLNLTHQERLSSMCLCSDQRPSVSIPYSNQNYFLYLPITSWTRLEYLYPICIEHRQEV